MGDLSKWEAKSAKTNIVVPLVALIVVLILGSVMAFLRPKPPEVQKKGDKAKQAIVEEESEEDIDWENF
ncbi:MAG: hypothetical protein JRG91_09400 [Deltaproteobacteria bacterium]|nr:hypothetical protein [Deltaproteobacteria bacterium]